MTNPELPPELDAAGLRRFGVTTGLIFAGLFGVFFPWWLKIGVPVWPWILAIVLVVFGLVAPSALRPVYIAWMKVGQMIGKVTSPIVLSLIFVIAILPPALVMKLTGRDLLARKYDREADTYRVISRKSPLENLKRPF